MRVVAAIHRPPAVSPFGGVSPFDLVVRNPLIIDRRLFRRGA